MHPGLCWLYAALFHLNQARPTALCAQTLEASQGHDDCRAKSISTQRAGTPSFSRFASSFWMVLAREVAPGSCALPSAPMKLPLRTSATTIYDTTGKARTMTLLVLVQCPLAVGSGE